MLLNLALILCAAAVAFAHSWVGCTDQDNTQILAWMKGNATQYKAIGDHYVDTFAPDMAKFCKGWPRAKHNPGDWVDETINYLWDIGGKSWQGDTNACHPSQRTPTYFTWENSNMAKTTPGGSIKIMFGGNGHSRGASVPGGKPGTVAVYWKGKPEAEIVDIAELNEKNKLKEIGFADEAFIWPADPNVKTPQQGMMDKGNWMTVEMPKNMAKGRHMMVWTWNFQGGPKFSTCFDVMIV